jgi:PPOX class probable F420-dependent enzyme
MDRGELDAYLAEPRNAVLASVNAQNAPVQVPVFFDWHDGNAYVSVTNQRGFFPNFARNPSVALCIDDQGPPMRTVLIRGDVAVIEGDAIWPHTERIIHKYRSGQEATEALERMRGEPLVILQITPTTITSWSPTPRDRDIWRAG